MRNRGDFNGMMSEDFSLDLKGSQNAFPFLELVGGFNHLEKILVNGKDYPIYYRK